MLNVQRSIWAGAAAYALNLTALSVLSNLIGPFMQGLTWAGTAYQVIVGIVTFGATFLAARWYFKGQHGASSANPTTGLIVGAVVALTSLVVTIVQVIPAIVMQGGSFSFILESFKNWPFWVIIAVTLVAGAVAGMQKKG